MDFPIIDPKVDREHAEMLQLLDSFDEIEAADDIREVRLLLGRLREHVVTHFGSEEKLFEQRLGMPAEHVARHKAEHERLRSLVLSVAHELADPEFERTAEAIARLRREIEGHIRGIDAELSGYAEARRIEKIRAGVARRSTP